ncbi:CYFA0S22e01024g1_1 [Cyberlindnera fabianii]|uniref:CYFA0S22e01024g1_1 n=1 Tax=Cyberlindnera fabianii TaxID=36022 RepID=A0A061BGQ7_CYBFA|nr:CYFA0S22e01024g1_1 [Cyberlindnera fabianii]
MTLRPVLVAIGGASSSGKSTVAKLIHSIAEGSYLFQQDDFFKDDNDIPIDEATGLQSWDCPEALNFDAFVQEVKHLKETGLADETLKNIRYVSDTKDQDLNSVAPEVLKQVKEMILPHLMGRKLIIVDGFMMFHDLSIIELFDIRIFIKASHDTLKQRRESRFGYQTQQTFWVDPPGYFDKIVYPAYAESHKILFNDDDVEKSVRQDIKDKYDIAVITNNNGTPIADTVLSVSKELESRLSKLD